LESVALSCLSAPFNAERGRNATREFHRSLRQRQGAPIPANILIKIAFRRTRTPNLRTISAAMRTGRPALVLERQDSAGPATCGEIAVYV
jgi:hypothetical protein